MYFRLTKNCIPDKIVETNVSNCFDCSNPEEKKNNNVDKKLYFDRRSKNRQCSKMDLVPGRKKTSCATNTLGNFEWGYPFCDFEKGRYFPPVPLPKIISSDFVRGRQYVNAHLYLIPVAVKNISNYKL